MYVRSRNRAAHCFTVYAKKFQVVIITIRLQDHVSQRKHASLVLDGTVFAILYLTKNDRHSRSSKVIDSDQVLIYNFVFLYELRNIEACDVRFRAIIRSLKDENKKDVGAECRHDMRPSVQLPSKLDLTMVRPSSHKASEPPALDPPPVSKHVR